MYIRSQNRDVLVNVNDICFNKLNIHSEIIYQFRCYGYGDDYYILGEYSTKEKALKVLDRIEELIKNQCILTFYMPVDDEVVTVKKRVDYAELRELEKKKELIKKEIEND